MKPLLSILVLLLCLSTFSTAQQEMGISFQSGSLTMEGTLTVPDGNGPFPTVIFMHEFGPKDRDGSTRVEGEALCYTPQLADEILRPFKDMAAAFGQNGIASIRYDKRTLTHEGTLEPRLLSPYDFVQDAQFAVEYAKTLPEVDAECIVLVGFGQGALLIPKVGRGVSGLISLAGAATSLDTVFAIKGRYFEEKCNGNPNAGEMVYQQTLADFDEIRACDWPANTPINGAFPDFWKDWSFMQDSVIQIYNDAGLPTLFLHGTQDLEVPIRDLGRFEAGVNTIDVQTHMLSGLSHYFTRLTTPNVEQTALDTMINWIKTTKQTTPLRELYTEAPAFVLYTEAEGLLVELQEPGMDIEAIGLYDLQGRQLFWQEGLRQKQYLLPRQETGIYVLSFVAGGRQLSRKVWMP